LHEMAASPEPHPDEIEGHPHLSLHINGNEQPPTLLTVCAECGNLRTILFLSKDRWFCFTCKTEGASVPNLYPIA
jgi:hypothetical protein